MDPPEALEVGQVLAEKYRIVKLLGRGGMGAVYAAVHTVVQHRFAIKVLSPRLNADPEAIARFRREAKAAGALESENIAAVVDFGETPEGLAFIVMEHLEGQDLASFLKQNGQLAVTRAISLVIQACRGLREAHAKGIVHRDLKPENLFLAHRQDGTDLLKVLDFGIAKLVAAENEPAVCTKTGTALGTCFYMSPEQARGAREVDARTDIYSLGVVLYELLSGRRPFDGASVNEIFYSILTQEPPALDGLRQGLPEGLSELIHRAMAKDVESRPRSVDELMAALSHLLDRRASPLPDLRQPSPLPDTARLPVPWDPKTVASVRKNNWKWWLAALILSTASAALFFGSKRSAEPLSEPAQTASSSGVPGKSIGSTAGLTSADVRGVSASTGGQASAAGSRRPPAQPPRATSALLASRRTSSTPVPESASSGPARSVHAQVPGRRVESTDNAVSAPLPRAARTESLYAP